MENPNWPHGLEDRLGEDRRNVIDQYKYWTVDAIKADLDTRRTKLVVAFENFANDFNIATGIRNANAFAAARVWICGARRYDKRGTVGTHNYEHVSHATSTIEVIEAHRAQGYRIVAADNIDGAGSLVDYQWEPDTLLIFGQESIGISQNALDLADDVVYIPQTGSVRSLNVGAASAVMMYDYVAKTTR